MTDPTQVQRTVEAVWRVEAAKVTAVVARLVGDIGLVCRRGATRTTRASKSASATAPICRTGHAKEASML